VLFVAVGLKIVGGWKIWDFIYL